MLATTARVEMGRLYHSETSTETIIVGTAAWYNWLEQHRDFTFVDRLSGQFLAHKRTSASGAFTWEASLVRAGRFYCLVLGPSQTLSLSRLQSVARALALPDVPAKWSDVPAPEPAASQSPPAQPVDPLSSRRSLLRTKVYLPRSSPDVIPRTRLLERLSAGLGGRVTLVCAPAGFGKTTLVVEWVKTLQRQVAWLSLDESDDELPVFVHALVAALQSAVPDGLGALASLFTAPQFPAPAELASLLSSDLADVAQDLVVVLDDYHLLHNAEVHALLEELISQLPCQVHLVLAARADPPLPLVPWQAKGWLSELRGSDLRFTLAETQAFLTGILGDELAEQLVAPMQDWTDGWIAVVRLLAFSLRTAPQPAAILDRLHSQPDGLVSEYLLEEILGQQAPEVQEVLLRTSLLEQFCAELCAALLGSAASAEQVRAGLVWLGHTNAFLIPLDEHQQWYRFHPLFKLLLHQRLQARSSHEELAALHRRASAWYAGQGLIDEAIKHALAAGDGSGAAQLVEAQVLRAYEQEQMVQLEGWLRLLPKEQLQGSPRLLFATAWILQAQGRLTDLPQLLSAAERLLATSDMHDGDDPQYRLLQALIAIGWSHFQFFTGQAQASLESARAALEWLPPAEAHLTSQAMQYLVWSKQATGQEDMALAALQQALRELPARPTITICLLLAQALVFLAAGKLPQVEQTARHLLRLAQKANLPLGLSWAHSLLGIVFYEWNRLDEVVFHCSAVIANRHQAHLWAVRESICNLALAYQAQGLSKEAHETAEALLDWVQGQHNLHELVTAYAFCGRLALVQDEAEKAVQWLELAGKQEVLEPTAFFEDPAINRARLLLAKGDQASVAQAQALLTHLLPHAEAMYSTCKMIQVLALQAWAYSLQGRQAQALDSLERALALGRPVGFVRTFADLPQLATMLRELRKRRKSRQGVDSALHAYIQRILMAMNQVAEQTSSREELLRQEGLEPLTERELYILRLLDKDLSNKEISRELVVTPGTVKVHTNNLYRKLSVNNRRAAVSLAKALGLLATA